MKSRFELNPINKINNIQDEIVRKVCFIALQEAQKNIHHSKSIAIDKVYKEVGHKLPKILRGEG